MADVQHAHKVRHHSCDWLLRSHNQCVSCRKYRSTLQAILSRRRTHAPSLVSSHKNIRYMTSSEKDSRMRELQRRNRALEKQVSRLREKISLLSAVCGVHVGGDTTTDLLTIMKSHGPDICTQHPPGSFRRIFWEQQFEAAGRTQKGMRWHPLMIRWCISLRYTLIISTTHFQIL